MNKPNSFHGKQCMLAFALTLMSALAYGQIGDQFPDLEGENLKHEAVILPDVAKGKYTLLGLAYSKKSEKALKTWFNPVYNQFIHKPEKPSIFDIQYDVNVFFIPMFSGAKRVAYQKVMKKMEANLDPKLHPYVLFYKGNLKDYQAALNFKGKDVPYFFVIDETGKIVFATSGSYAVSKMQAVVDRLPF